MTNDEIEEIVDRVSTIVSVTVAVQYIAYLFYLTLWPIMAQESGLSGAEIGIYMSLPVLVQLIAIPLVNHYSVKYNIEVI